MLTHVYPCDKQVQHNIINTIDSTRSRWWRPWLFSTSCFSLIGVANTFHTCTGLPPDKSFELVAQTGSPNRSRAASQHSTTRWKCHLSLFIIRYLCYAHFRFGFNARYLSLRPSGGVEQGANLPSYSIATYESDELQLVFARQFWFKI